MSVGILGGTGPAGKALAARLAACGLEVVIGSRQSERAEEAASEIKERWGDRELSLVGAENAAAVASDLVVLATPWEGAAPTAQLLRRELAGKVVVSMVNALAKVGSELLALVPPSGSIAAAIQLAAPEALVAGAFHHVPARGLANLAEPLDGDVLICSDHEKALEETRALVDTVPGLRAVAAGSLASAAAIEAFTAVLVNINIAHRVRSSIRLTGFEGNKA